MKRTTYIMIGMLVTGVAMVCGLMFYVVDRNVTQKDNFMEIGGERKTVQLPSCRVLKLTQPPVVWKQKKEGIVEAERMFSFGEVPLEVTAGDSLQQGSFSYAGDMEAFMSMTSVGDTLLVTFDFPEDKLEQHLQNDIWIRVRSEGMELRLPAEVQAVVVDVEDMEPISTDSVAIRSLSARDTMPGWKIAMSLRLRRRRRACISTAAQCATFI